jgi:hypothetical protein
MTEQTRPSESPFPESVTLYVGSGEWSALYVNGVLETVGDHYLADERIRKIFGVAVVDSDDFLRGGNGRTDVARTVQDIAAYAMARDDRLRRAAELREQAVALEAEAAALSRQSGPSNV